MQKYEYFTFEWSHGGPQGALDDQFKGMSFSGVLNSLGREGWELVTATAIDAQQSTHKYILKRAL